MKCNLAIAIAIALGTSALTVPISVAAASDSEEIRLLRQQMEELQRKLEALESRTEHVESKTDEIASKATAKDAKDKALHKAVQVYGQVRVSVDNQSNDFTDDGTAINSNASRLGVQGSIPTTIGDTDLFYRAEVRYETTDFVNGGPGTTTGTRQLEFREGFVGLKNKKYGKLRLGRLVTEYKKTLTTIDPWNDNTPQSRAGGRQGSSELHSSYFNNSADYVTPSFLGGLSGSVWYATLLDNSGKPLHNTGTLKNYEGGQAGGVGVKYKHGPIFLAADYIDMDADNIKKAGLENDSGWQVAARYQCSSFSISAFHEDVEDLGLGKNTYVNGIYKLGRTRLIAAYGMNRDGAVYKDEDYDNWSLGVKYGLTDRSELLAAFNRRSNNDTNQDFDTVTVGINAKFGYPPKSKKEKTAMTNEPSCAAGLF